MAPILALPKPTMSGPNEHIWVNGKCVLKVTHTLQPSLISSEHAASPYPNIHHCRPDMRAESGPCISALSSTSKPGFRGPRDIDPLFTPEHPHDFQLSPPDEKRAEEYLEPCDMGVPWPCIPVTKRHVNTGAIGSLTNLILETYHEVRSRQAFNFEDSAASTQALEPVMLGMSIALILFGVWA